MEDSISVFSENPNCLPEDVVFYYIIPDLSLSPHPPSPSSLSSSLQSLHLQILSSISPFTSSYIWQHQPFTLSLSTSSSSTCPCSPSSLPPHLHGHLRYGDNLDDEWFVVFLLFHISRTFPDLSIRVWDSDGEFLLIEAAFHLPRWLNPDTSVNRVFLRRGDLHVVPKSKLPSPSLVDSLKFIIENESVSRADDAVQGAVKSRIKDYPEKAFRNTHRVRVRVPLSVAHVLKYEPCLISLAVEGFYDRDVESMKFAAKMERFLGGINGERDGIVCVSVSMSRAMYGQLMQQRFQAPKCYPMPKREEGKDVYLEAELGMKISVGLEMMYQMRKREGVEGKGSNWEKYKESLERSGYFQGLIPGSKEYKKLMEKAEGYYRNSSLFTKTSDMLNEPVRRIDEILALPHSVDDYSSEEVPPSDDDSWLYSGEDELNSVLLERQKEMDAYNAKQKKKHKSKEISDTGPSMPNSDGYDLGDIAKTMQAFVQKMSSYKGAEVPEIRDEKEVNFDVDRFIKDMNSVMRCQDSEDPQIDNESDEAPSSDMDFDESEDESDGEDKENSFMLSYEDALRLELKPTTISRSFVRANEETSKTDEGPSRGTEDMDEDFTPVDVDVNLVKSFLESFSSQEGLPGPASNLLGLMGLNLPPDDRKGK